MAVVALSISSLPSFAAEPAAKPGATAPAAKKDDRELNHLQSLFQGNWKFAPSAGYVFAGHEELHSLIFPAQGDIVTRYEGTKGGVFGIDAVSFQSNNIMALGFSLDRWQFDENGANTAFWRLFGKIRVNFYLTDRTTVYAAAAGGPVFVTYGNWRHDYPDRNRYITSDGSATEFGGSFQAGIDRELGSKWVGSFEFAYNMNDSDINAQVYQRSDDTYLNDAKVNAKYRYWSAMVRFGFLVGGGDR